MTLDHIDTDDLLHDYHLMLPDFGANDPDVKAYAEELDRRQIDVIAVEMYRHPITGLYALRCRL